MEAVSCELTSLRIMAPVGRHSPQEVASIMLCVVSPYYLVNTECIYRLSKSRRRHFTLSGMMAEEA